MKRYKIVLKFNGKLLKGTVKATCVADCLAQLTESFPGHTNRTMVIV